MEKQVILVTGSSQGIGAATIIEFAKLGYNVIINYLTHEEEANLLKEFVEENYKVKSKVIKCDVSKEEEVKIMIEEIIKEFGHLDVVVNNASIAIDTVIEDKTIPNFKKILDVNLLGTFLVSKYAIEQMNLMGRGVIINVSSTNGIDTNYPESLDYDAAKAGVISLTKNFAKAYAPSIRVNAVAPGWVKTPMNKDLDQEFIEKELENIFLKRFAEPSEIAKVICFLASDDASYITGTTIRVDGGF